MPGLSKDVQVGVHPRAGGRGRQGRGAVAQPDFFSVVCFRCSGGGRSRIPMLRKPFGGRQDSGSGLRCGQRVCWQMWRGAWGPFWEAPFGESPPKGYGTLTFLQQKCNFPMLFLMVKAESYARLIKILYGQKAWKLLPKTAILQTVYSFRTVYGDDWEHFGEFVLSWHMNCTR